MQSKPWLMLSLQVAFKETTGTPSSGGLMAGVGGVGHVGLRTISREIARRETCAGRGTDRKREPLPARRPSTVIRISSIQSNVFLPDCKIKGVPVSAVVDCGSPICILSNEFFKYIGVNDILGNFGSSTALTEAFSAWTKVAGFPVDLNVGERVVMESPTARVIDALLGDTAPILCVPE